MAILRTCPELPSGPVDQDYADCADGIRSGDGEAASSTELKEPLLLATHRESSSPTAKRRNASTLQSRYTCPNGNEAGTVESDETAFGSNPKIAGIWRLRQDERAGVWQAVLRIPEGLTVLAQITMGIKGKARKRQQEQPGP
jgi:hypothetical protein